METIPEILLEEESWRGDTVITPGFIEKLGNKERLMENEYTDFGVIDQECDNIGEMCDLYEGL